MMASGEIRLSTTTMRQMPVLAQSQNPIQNFLCHNSGGDSLARQAADNVGDAGAAADFVHPVLLVAQLLREPQT